MYLLTIQYPDGSRRYFVFESIVELASWFEHMWLDLQEEHPGISHELRVFTQHQWRSALV